MVCKLTNYGYNSSEYKFKDSECALESLKGEAKGAVRGACLAGGALLAPAAGVMVPITAIGTGAVSEVASEATGQLCNGEKIDGRKLIVAGTVGGVSGGAGWVAGKVVNKLPLNKVADVATKKLGNSVSGASG